MSETLEQTVEAWLRSQQAAGCSRNTLRLRRDWMRRLCVGSDPRTWGPDQIVDYLSSNPAWSANTRATYFRCLSSWFRWLEETERLERSPLRKVRRPRSPRGVPHPVDTQLLERAIAESSGHLRAWLILGAYQGLRRSEIAAFRGEQIRGQELRITGKGNVTAVLPVHPRVAELAALYPRRGHWFPAGAGARTYPHLSPYQVGQRVKEHLIALDGTGTLHSLRHWFGTEVLEASGGNLRTAQQLLRHASVATTELYTQVRDANRTAAVLALPDVGGAR